jgi:subtilisin family serine protease
MHHSTHIAGIAAGNLLNGKTATSVATGASIVAVKIMDSNGQATFASILRGLTWITAKVKEQRSTGIGPNIVAVNMSLGSGSYTAPCDNEGQYAGFLRRVRELKGEGVAVFAAAGNDGQNAVSFPGCITDVIPVGSTDRNGNMSAFTNYSGLVSLVAPAENVVSSQPGGTYAALSGTSMATAMAAGSFAVLKGAFPEMDVDVITTAIKRKGLPITVAKTNAVVRSIDVASSYAFLRILASELQEGRPSAAPGVSR